MNHEVSINCEGFTVGDCSEAKEAIERAINANWQTLNEIAEENSDAIGALIDASVLTENGYQGAIEDSTELSAIDTATDALLEQLDGLESITNDAKESLRDSIAEAKRKISEAVLKLLENKTKIEGKYPRKEFKDEELTGFPLPCYRYAKEMELQPNDKKEFNAGDEVPGRLVIFISNTKHDLSIWISWHLAKNVSVNGVAVKESEISPYYDQKLVTTTNNKSQPQRALVFDVPMKIGVSGDWTKDEENIAKTKELLSAYDIGEISSTN